jgi:hypothetical protein
MADQHWMLEDWRGPFILAGEAIRERLWRHEHGLDREEVPGVMRGRPIPRAVARVLEREGLGTDGQPIGERLAREQREAHVMALRQELERARFLSDETLEAAVLQALEDAGEDA